MKDQPECRCLNSKDDKELHQFAATFSAYMKAKINAPVNPKIRKLIDELKREMTGDDVKT
ncbi:MAG: hypothetical protein ACR2O4_09310 [Hyphomicrobiaceae bacterium]